MPAYERTVAGLQYVIPGAERRHPLRARAYPSEGAQLVIPGAERISTRALLARRMAAPLVPRRGQRSLNSTPLFGTGGFSGF